ncbi:MAG: hypothetical protein M0033_06095 [Nitrospiraceae bacterium]|nr:hypothetical protein [Nitrospiraceae bacterium]
MKRVFLVSLALLMFAGAAFSQTGGVKRRPLPWEYGRVVINNYSQEAGLPPVVFDHWLHRAKYTCRLCHVDLGFAMKAGGTGIKAEDNMQGYYCGACHNGKSVLAGRIIFEACGKVKTDDCLRCHSLGQRVKRDYDFRRFTAGLPRGRFGNGIDWEKAELQGLIKPIDYIEGVSIKRGALPIPKDTQLQTNMAGMPDIIFSHKKHAAWSGCELCHPEIFGVKKGASYSMDEIFGGKYCGACHGLVAFPSLDCQRCHAKPVY